MDALKLQRKILRATFTNHTKVISGEITKTEANSVRLNELNSQLYDKYQRLETVQQTIFDLLLSVTDTDQEKEYTKEFNDAEHYREQYLSFKAKLEALSAETNFDDQSVNSPCNRKYRLPKLELQKFNGDIKSFLGFWSQFSRIHEDKDMPSEDKFQYLIQAITPGSRAASLIQSFPPTAQNYPKAIELLKERFGRDDLLVQVYVRELLKMVMKNAVCGKKCTDLTTLYDQLESHLRSLDTLGRSKEKFADFLSPLVESCLPEEVLRAWERHRVSSIPNPGEEANENSQRSLEKLMNFLRQEVNGEEMISLARSGFGAQVKPKKEFVDSINWEVPSASTLTSSTQGRGRCAFCSNFHFSQDCGKARTMTRDEKKIVLMRKGLCLVCLKAGHMAKNCRSNVHCIICSKRHYTILCPELPKASKSTSPKSSIKEEENTSTLFTVPTSTKTIYLKTLLVRLKNKGRSQYVRALLDDGSHRSYIEKDLAQELRLSPSGKEVLSQGLFGGKQTPEDEHYRYSVNIQELKAKFSCQVSVLDQSKICATIPRVHDPNLLSELRSRGIILSDLGSQTPPIRLLLGADVLGRILTGRIEVLKSGISAIETKLGWSILGTERKNTVIGMVTVCMQNFEIPNIWELETLGINDPTERKTAKMLEDETLTHFRETIKKDGSRYEVTLPWLIGHPPVYERRDVAESRLRSVTKRLLKEEIYEAYDAVFKQWQSEGIIETVSEDEVLMPSHYLPHRPVIKPSSNTTKVRPVFDASFRRPGYASLNDCLSVGPSLSQQIPPLLLRFRLGTIGVIADIKQAFLQLRVKPEDRDFLRFLWWQTDDRSKMKVFRHCRVVFGVSSSPFLLNASIAHHLDSKEFQDVSLRSTVEKLKVGFYVDNLTTSVEGEKDFEQFKTQALKIMNEGSFELRCWARSGDQNLESQNVLGLRWNTQSDELYCSSPTTDGIVPEVITKRKLLSVVNSIYDPVGFTSPATLLPKLLLQEAWCRKIDWDEELPSDIQLRYQRWVKDIYLVERCRIPRKLIQGTIENTTLHIFTDASAVGYACCAFLRCEENSEVTISLVFAKARVAPVQKPTIPRLELLGAAIGARMGAAMLEALKLPLKTYYWTDSMVVLGWITNKEPWNTFVGNRVKEIRELTDIRDWRHVPGDINPADLPSRSCNWSNLVRSQWWNGPMWLREQPEFWPNSEIILPEDALLERRKTVLTALIVDNKEDFGGRFLYFSSYQKILRMTAWMLRFCNNAKRESLKLTGELSCEEIESAEKALVRIIQSEWPSDTREGYSRSIQFYEENGILKIQSRLILGSYPENFVRPTVLPDHPITRKMIEHVHRKLLHTGVQTTLARMRERFWIPRGRRVVREVVKKCIICKRFSSKPVVPVAPSPLPIDRINRVAAFEVTGADLAGPVYLRGGTKSWIVIFTCAVYRAIHLELVTSLSTEAFMQAMRRFIARRGRCSTMYTDNGTNFLGTARALHSVNWQEVETECALQQIKWHFNPPSAPWYGGWWERMIRTVKQLLKKSLGRASVTYEEMITLLCECESVVNSRPLTYMFDDPNELKALTPADFIQDLRGNETVDLDIVDSKHLRKRIRYIQELRQQLRRRFKEEYLSELVRNPQLSSNRQNLARGDIVLVGSDNTKRFNWPLGRVLELFPGKDNIERVVKLRVANGEILRPVQRIYPLEINSTEISKCVPNATNYATKPAPAQHLKDKRKTCSVPRKTRCGRMVIPPKRLGF